MQSENFRQIVKETIGVGVNEKAALRLIKLPFRLRHFRFFLGEQSASLQPIIYGDSIFVLFPEFNILIVL